MLSYAACRLQVGDTTTDHSGWWGRPEQQPQNGTSTSSGWRPAFTHTYSSTGAAADVLGSSAASMVGAALVLQKPGAYQDTTMAADLIRRARQLLAAGNANKGSFIPKAGQNAYPSGVSSAFGK